MQNINNTIRKYIQIDKSFLFDSSRYLYGLLSYLNKNGTAILPFRYSFELTYRCNLRCPYCYIGDDRNKNELSTQEWFNIIDQVPRYAFISLIGGEPLLREDFIPILQKCSKRTLNKVNIVSNGSLLTDEIINELIKQKLLMFSVSLDGYGATHDLNRGSTGLFEKVTSNIEKLNNAKKNKKDKPYTDIKTVILENNLNELPKLYKLSNELNSEYFSLSFKRNNMMKQNSNLYETFNKDFYETEYPIELYFDMENFKEIYKELESQAKSYKTKLRWAPKFHPTGDLKKIEKFFSSNASPKDLYHRCLTPYSNININPEGDIYPCLSLKIGNVKENKIKDIINMPKFKCFRKNLKASKLFPACQMCCEIVPKIK
ncbi:MAG: radical SAM protein [Candidatus Gastranaerophilales bacterium]|nr:radical SAM protein [Candidatus Gastranaerophilales bacterium]